MPHSAAPPAGRVSAPSLHSLALDLASLALAACAGVSLFRLGDVLRRNPFELADLFEFLAALVCTLSVWGFCRFLFDLAWARSLGDPHSAQVAWWLTGGVWAAVVLIALSAENTDYATFVAVQLGTLLTAPVVLVLLVRSLTRTERRRAHWRAWLGFAVGLTIPVPWVLSLLSLL